MSLLSVWERFKINWFKPNERYKPIRPIRPIPPPADRNQAINDLIAYARALSSEELYVEEALAANPYVQPSGVFVTGTYLPMGRPVDYQRPAYEIAITIDEEASDGRGTTGEVHHSSPQASGLEPTTGNDQQEVR